MIELKLIWGDLLLNTKRPWKKKRIIKLTIGFGIFILQCDTNKEGIMFAECLRDSGLTVEKFPYWVEGILEEKSYSPRDIETYLTSKVPMCNLTIYGKTETIIEVLRSFSEYYLIIENENDNLILR